MLRHVCGPHSHIQWSTIVGPTWCRTLFILVSLAQNKSSAHGACQRVSVASGAHDVFHSHKPGNVRQCVPNNAVAERDAHVGKRHLPWHIPPPPHPISSCHLPPCSVYGIRRPHHTTGIVFPPKVVVSVVLLAGRLYDSDIIVPTR